MDIKDVKQEGGKKSRVEYQGVKAGRISCSVCVGPMKQGGANTHYI